LILAELNLFVGIFNLLPLLPLDGGHIAILGFEEARSRVYRVLGRRDPGRVDIMKVLPLTYAVVAVFVGLSLILLYAGITNPIRLQ
jgi:membrane-associated protease RseP (regulator of RpoE activity)